MLDAVAEPVSRKAVRLKNFTVVLLSLSVVIGCGTVSNVGSAVTVSHPVWMPDGWVYYLREVSSEGAEIWRQRADQEVGQYVLGKDDIVGGCDVAAFSFLFRATDDDLGIAAECVGNTSMELTMYSPNRTDFTRLTSTPFLSGMAFNVGTATGYVEQPTGCGIAIRPIRDGTVEEFAKPITVAGKSWLLSGAEQPDCGSVAWSRSPVLAPDGSVFFLTAPGSIGKFPVTDPDALDEFEWYLCSWDGESSTPRVVTTLRGVADLAVSPDGRFVVAAVSTPGSGGISMVDNATGKVAEIVNGQQAYHPSLSADGSRFVYVDNLTRLRFGSLPRAI
ncbi:MAG: TolB family protein [Pseudonocardiales bacterium]